MIRYQIHWRLLYVWYRLRHAFTGWTPTEEEVLEELRKTREVL